MPSAADYLLSAAAGAKPKLVITGPDGSQLWLDVAPSTSAGPSLWPEGYAAQLQFGAIPAAPNVTGSAGRFLFQQSPTLATRRGPLGVPWGLWAVAVLALLLAPFLPQILRPHKKP